MTFEEAIKAAKDGKCIKRKEWPDGRLLKVAQMFVDNSGSMCSASMSDMFADDWDTV